MVDPMVQVPRPDAPEVVSRLPAVGVRARNEPAAVGAEADEEARVADGILRSQDALEPAPVQVPDPDPGLLPAADRQPAAVRADGDRRSCGDSRRCRGPLPGSMAGWGWLESMSKTRALALSISARVR